MYYSGGKVVILEITEDVIRAKFAFGLLPGWWLSKFEQVKSQKGTDNLLKARNALGNGGPVSQSMSGMVFCANQAFRGSIFKFLITLTNDVTSTR